MGARLVLEVHLAVVPTSGGEMPAEAWVGALDALLRQTKGVWAEAAPVLAALCPDPPKPRHGTRGAVGGGTRPRSPRQAQQAAGEGRRARWMAAMRERIRRWETGEEAIPDEVWAWLSRALQDTQEVHGGRETGFASFGAGGAGRLAAAPAGGEAGEIGGVA